MPHGPAPFVPNADHMDPADLAPFAAAADLLDGQHLTAAIFAAGGNRAHVNLFSRRFCGGRPVDPWRDDQKDDAAVAAMLKGLSDGN